MWGFTRMFHFGIQIYIYTTQEYRLRIFIFDFSKKLWDSKIAANKSWWSMFYINFGFGGKLTQVATIEIKETVGENNKIIA
jgi:hypothetical protein